MSLEEQGTTFCIEASCRIAFDFPVDQIYALNLRLSQIDPIGTITQQDDSGLLLVVELWRKGLKYQ